MNLLLLFDYYHPYIGGAEIVNKKISEYLNREHNLAVVSKKFFGCSDTYSLINNVHVYRTPNVPRLLHSITAPVYAVKHARKADIIIAATYSSALAGYLLAKKFKKKSAILVHEILDENWKYFKKNHYMYRFYERYVTTRKFDVYIVFSHYTREKLLKYKIPEQNIRVIYHGIDEGLFSPRPLNRALRYHIAGDAEFMYLYFGRPGGSKGIEYLLEASGEIVKKIKKSRLVMILASEPRREYNNIVSMISKLGLSDHVRVMPPVDRNELADYVNIADVVVVPSLSEGFGFTAAESCCLGKAVVVTDTGSLPEVVSGRVIKVKKADSRALAAGIYRAYQGEFDIIPQKIFRWDMALTEYEKVLDELIVKEK